MLKTAVVVESPGKIKSIQKYLGDKYIVLASKGHIVELAKGGRFGIGVNPMNKFQAFYILMQDKIQFLDDIISNVDNLDRIILATDGDTEGASIAWHIASYLRHLNKPIFRAEFNEITQEGVLAGIQKLSDLDINKFKAQETRRVLDRIVGFMVSPFLINYYGNNLSAGRVQSVTTKLVIEREREINTFKPEEYWNILVNLKKDNEIFTAKLNRRSKISSREEAEKIKLELEQESVADSIFTAEVVNKKPKLEYPNPPLNTSKMQQVMASKFGIDGDRTMAAAQALYEAGIVTYIRTDSVRAAEKSIDSVRQWLNDNNFSIPKKPNSFKNKEAAQDAHECIRPTNVTNIPDQANLTGDNKILYQIIWSYFVASQMSPAIYDTLDAKIVHNLSKINLRVSGKLLKEPGYLSILESKIKSNGTLPSLNKGDELRLVDGNSIRLEQKFTQPPSRYNYGSLVKELENRGIGRPSTFSEIINKITYRNYVEKRGNTFHGTEIGDKITSILSNYFEFMNYNYTAELEKQMDEISLGKLDSQTVLSDFYKKFQETLNKAYIDNGGSVCKACNAPMFLRNSKNGQFFACSLFPFCKNTLSADKNSTQTT